MIIITIADLITTYQPLITAEDFINLNEVKMYDYNHLASN